MLSVASSRSFPNFLAVHFTLRMLTTMWAYTALKAMRNPFKAKSALPSKEVWYPDSSWLLMGLDYRACILFHWLSRAPRASGNSRKWFSPHKTKLKCWLLADSCVLLNIIVSLDNSNFPKDRNFFNRFKQPSAKFLLFMKGVAWINLLSILFYTSICLFSTWSWWLTHII